MQRMNLIKIYLNLWIIIENVRNHRDIKLVTPEKRRKRLVSQPNYHSYKIFSDHLMAIEMRQNKNKNE